MSRMFRGILLCAAFAMSASADTVIAPNAAAKRFLRLTSDPASCKQGDVWVNITSGLFKGCTPDATVVAFTVGGITQAAADLRYQPLDGELTAIAGLTSAADRLAYFTGSGTAALAVFTSAGRALVDDTDATAQRTTLGLVIGTNVEAWDADLDTLASSGVTGTGAFVRATGNTGTATALQNARTINGDSFDGTGNIQNTLASSDFANQGTTTTLFHGNAAGNPSFGSVVSADMNITTTSCTNQLVSAISAGGVGTCSTVTLAGAQFVNQGTTTTVLHGNAAGNPAFGKVVDGDVTFTAPALGAPTATTVQTSGNVGLGGAPSGTASQFATVTDAADATTQVVVNNTNASGTTANATFQVLADTANLQLKAHGTGRVTSRFGQTIGGWAELLSSNGNGILFGTSVSGKPVIVGSGGGEAMRWTNQDTTIPAASASTGQCTLNAAATATCTATVPSGCIPICSYNSAATPHTISCSVTTTTLTAVSATTLDGGVVNYHCF